MPQRPGGPVGADHSVEELIRGAFRSVALTVEVFLHWNPGLSYVGNGPAGLLAIWLFSMFCSGQDISPLLEFGATYFVIWVVVLIGSIVRTYRPRGRRRLHTMYGGYPHLCRIAPGLDESVVKHFEGPVVAAIGLMARGRSEPLGNYLVFAGAASFLRVFLTAARMRHVTSDLSDRAIEQEEIGQRFQDRNGQ